MAARALRKSVAKAASEFALSFTSIKSVTVERRRRLEIRLSEPNSFVLPDLAAGLASGCRTSRRSATGPFRIVKQDDEHTVLTAFPQYYRGRPALDEIDVTTYPTQRKAWAALMRGEIDMLHEVSRDAAEFVEAETTVKTYSFPRPYYIPLVFNVRHPILKNPDVRQAINEALDQAALIRDGMSGRGRPADGPIWPEHWAYSPPAGPFVFDPGAARLRTRRARASRSASARTATCRRGSRFTCLVFAERSAVRAPCRARSEAAGGRRHRHEAAAADSTAARGASEERRLRRLPVRDVRPVARAGSTSSGTRHEQGHFNSGYRAADAVLDRIRGAVPTTRSARSGGARPRSSTTIRRRHSWPGRRRRARCRRSSTLRPKQNRDILANVWQWRAGRR